MSFDAETFFLFQPFQTDDLKAEIETQRENLRGKQADYHALQMRIEDASNNLTKMEEKATFVENQIDQISAMFVPPPESDAEIASDALEKYLNTPVTMAAGSLITVGVGAFLVSGLAPPLLRVVSKAPKMAKAAKLAKSAKFLKVAKFAKATVALGIALGVLELVVEFATASEINKQLRKDQKKLTDAINEADALLAEMNASAVEVEKVVADLLSDAGFADMAPNKAMEAYVGNMNNAIAGLGRQKAVARMVRKMALLGLTVDMIATTSELDTKLVEDLLKKLEIERALAAGDDAKALADRFQIGMPQVQEISKIVEARGALVAGETIEALSERTGLSRAILSGEADENALRLAPHWQAIESGDSLEALVGKVLVAKDHLARLHKEISAKKALADGADISDLAGSYDVDIETVTTWNVAMAEARDQVKMLSQKGTTSKPENLAASLRLPMALAA